jgi:hypothetical protein
MMKQFAEEENLEDINVVSKIPVGHQIIQKLYSNGSL